MRTARVITVQLVRDMRDKGDTGVVNAQRHDSPMVTDEEQLSKERKGERLTRPRSTTLEVL